MRAFAAIIILIVFLPLSLIEAQDIPTQDVAPSGTTDIQIQAPDGKSLYGSYFAAENPQGPSVLLLHQLYTNRSSWKPLIEPLLDAGFNVLAIDLRGYGKTRGKINWTAAEDDTVSWSNWLKTESNVQSIAIVGSSMGSNLALVGCAAVQDCAGAVAISPSLNYFGVKTTDAMQAGFPALIVYADQDRYPKEDVPTMLELGGDHVTTIVYTGRMHGMNLFNEHDDLASQIVSWLQQL